VCLITTRFEIIKIGGFFGEFLMSTQEQRTSFKKLITLLRSHIGVFSDFPLDQRTLKSQSFLSSWTVWKVFICNIPFFIILFVWIFFLTVISSPILRVEISNMIFYPLIELTLTRWFYDLFKIGRWALQEENPEFFDDLSD
jgi:hypothetical protein